MILFRFAADPSDAKAIKEAESAVASLSGDDAENGALYVSYMKKAAEKGGADYLKGELQRLEKVIFYTSLQAFPTPLSARQKSPRAQVRGRRHIMPPTMSLLPSTLFFVHFVFPR
jgi:hypothetical protein